MQSADVLARTLAPHAGRLIGVARESIRCGLFHGRALEVSTDAFDPVMRAPGASFVTLHRGDMLRGCIGTIEPRMPLVEDIASNAFLAAFRDGRFDPLDTDEFAGLTVEIAVLGPPVPLPFASEAELIGRLVPGRDGLILERAGSRAVFLPQVWEDLPDPAGFIAHLKAKLGVDTAPLGPDTSARRFAAVKLAADV